MSNEWRKRALPAARLRASASVIVRPMTNCSPISRIACRIATRTTGSPARATTRSYQLAGSLADSASICVSLPVSISPQVDALTSSDGLCPRCFCQSPRESLSRISRSAVSASGMRNSASATHISSTPSCVDKSYCCRNDSMPALPACRARTASTQPRARALMRADAAGSAAASGSSRATMGCRPRGNRRGSTQRRGFRAAAGRSSLPISCRWPIDDYSGERIAARAAGVAPPPAVRMTANMWVGLTRPAPISASSRACTRSTKSLSQSDAIEKFGPKPRSTKGSTTLANPMKRSNPKRSTSRGRTSWARIPSKPLTEQSQSRNSVSCRRTGDCSGAKRAARARTRDDGQRFRPPLMAVAADDIGDDEPAVRSQGGGDRVEKVLERRDVVQRLVGNDAVELAAWPPCVEVGAYRDDVLSTPCARARLAPRPSIASFNSTQSIVKSTRPASRSLSRAVPRYRNCPRRDLRSGERRYRRCRSIAAETWRRNRPG